MSEPIYNEVLAQFVKKHGHRPGKTPTAAEIATKAAIDVLASDAMALQAKRPFGEGHALRVDALFRRLFPARPRP